MKSKTAPQREVWNALTDQGDPPEKRLNGLEEMVQSHAANK